MYTVGVTVARMQKRVDSVGTLVKLGRFSSDSHLKRIEPQPSSGKTRKAMPTTPRLPNAMRKMKDAAIDMAAGVLDGVQAAASTVGKKSLLAASKAKRLSGEVAHQVLAMPKLLTTEVKKQ